MDVIINDSILRTKVVEIKDYKQQTARKIKECRIFSVHKILEQRIKQNKETQRTDAKENPLIEHILYLIDKKALRISTFTGFTNITAQAPGRSSYAYSPDFTLTTPAYALGDPAVILPGKGNNVRIKLNGKDPTNYRLNLIGADGTYKAVYYSANYIDDADVENYLKTAPQYISGITPLPANFYEFYLFVVDNNGKVFRYDISFPKY